MVDEKTTPTTAPATPATPARPQVTGVARSALAAEAREASVADAAERLEERVRQNPVKAAGEQFLANLTKGQAATALATDEGDEEGTDDSDETTAAPKDDEASPYREGEGDEEGTDGEEGAEGAAESDAPKAEVIVLKGLAERGEADVELPIEDPVIAERIRRLQNDGMRTADYKEKLSALREREQTYDELSLIAETNPEGFALDVVPKQHQLRVAKALLVEHWDALVPELQKFFEDPAAVPTAQRDAARAARDGDAETQQARVRRDRAGKIRDAVSGQIPEGIAHETAAAFWQDAERDIVDAINRGEAVTPERVPALLARRRQLYGFGESKGSTSQTATPAKGPAASRPAVTNGRPTDDAARRAAVTEQQTRLKQDQSRRRNAAAIAPAGRGAAVTRKPLVAEGADIQAAGKAVLATGATTWDQLRTSPKRS